MTFLYLNGWEVPTLRGSKMAPKIIGDKDYAFDGTIMRDRRKIKRRWNYSSSSLDQQDAEALIRQVLGEGDTWSFDSDLYSGKGMGPLSSTIGSRRIGIAADTRDVVDINNKNESYFGDYSLATEQAVTNLFNANTRDAELAPTGYNAVIVVSSVLSASSSYVVQGSKSVRDVTSLSGDGLESDTVSVTPGWHTATVYVLATSSSSMNFSFVNAATGVPFSINGFTTVANKWVRVTFSTNVGVATIRIRITNNSGGALTFYTDAWQLETGQVSTTWADPSRAAGDLEIPASILTGPSFTFAAWVRGQTANPSSIIYIVSEVTTSGDVFKIQRSSGANLIAVTLGRGGSVQQFVYSSSPWDTDWHHVAVTCRASDGYTALYFDGTDVANQTTTDYPDFTAFADDGFYLGHDNSSNYWEGLIDDVVMVPWAAPAAQISAWYNLGFAFPTLPRMRAKGEFHETFPAPSGEETGDLVEGVVNESAYGGVMISGSFANNAQRVSFELESV